MTGRFSPSGPVATGGFARAIMLVRFIRTPGIFCWNANT